jgi:hypothetical protein
MSRNRSRYISSLFPNSCLVTFRKKWRYIFFHLCVSQLSEIVHDSFRFSFSILVPHNVSIQVTTDFFHILIPSWSSFHFFAFASCPKRSKSLTEQPNNWNSSTLFHPSYKTVLKNWMAGYTAVRITNGHSGYLTLQLHDWKLNMIQTIFLNILFHCRWFEETRPHMIHETDSQSNVTNAVCCGRHKSP